LIRLALRLAFRDLRGALNGLGWVVACLALGVAAIAAAGSLDAGLRRTLAEDGRSLLGGDMVFRLAQRPASTAETAFLREFGTLSEATEMRAMARRPDAGTQTLVEIKAVDGRYPLYGQLRLDPAVELGRGVACDPNLLDRLGVAVGEPIVIGAATFTVRAVITGEPDRIASPVTFGPRLLMDGAGLAATGLVQEGSMIRHLLMLRLAAGVSADEVRTAAGERFPSAGWQIQDSRQAAPGLVRFLDNMALFLTLVGLTALLVGGIGVATGARAFLDSRRATVAILKCLGASQRLIVAALGLEVAALSGLGIVLGLAAGAALPALLVALAGDSLPIAARLGLFWRPLVLAALFGGLTGLAFTAWPLGRAGRVPAAALLRDIVAADRRRPSLAAISVSAAAVTGLAALAVVSAADRPLAAWFVAGTAVCLGLFALAGVALARLARRAAGRALALPLRLAASSLSRPGAATQGVVLSLGLGLTVLAAVGLVEANLADEIDRRLPAEAPSFFFIDIQDDQVAAFDAAVAAAGGSAVKRAPMVRGRVTAIDGQAVERRDIAPGARWAVQGDRGLSVAARPPDDAKVVAGGWWPPDYAGPPLVSLDAGIARGFGLGVGQSITVNVLGREVTAKIANLREIDWSSLAMNFTFILSPDALAGAPRSWIATVHAPPGGEAAVERAVTRRLPSVSAIRVKEALVQARHLVEGVATAMKAAAAVTLAAGALVLAGAIAAGQRRRVHEAVLLKVLGAARRDLVRAVGLEYALLGGATGLLAALLGSAAAWALLTFVLKADWRFLPGPLAATVAAGLSAVAVTGVVGTWRALRTSVADHLRHD